MSPVWCQPCWLACADAAGSWGGGHGPGAVPEALQRGQVGRAQRRVIEYLVDHRRRQERVGDPVLPDQREELSQVGAAHDDDLATPRQDREAQHAGGIGERGECQVDRPAVAQG